MTFRAPSSPLAVFGLALLLGLPVLLLAGCKSTSGTSSARLASVAIPNRSLAEVSAAAKEVFTEDGYQGVQTKSGDWVFEKKGNVMKTLVYGDWSATPVWLRVKVYLNRTRSADEVLLDCDAFALIDHGGRNFEEEHQLTGMHRRTYQELLEKVKHRLQ
jgi:hypothetical protein